MDPTLPAALVCASLGMALGAVPMSTWRIPLALFGAAAIALGTQQLPVAWQDAILLGGWVSIVASAASVHGPSYRLVLALSCGAGMCVGGLIGTTGVRWPLACAPSMLLIALPVRAIHVRAPIAVKVLSSWLIAVAVLAGMLRFVSVTPGYLPDHVE